VASATFAFVYSNGTAGHYYGLASTAFGVRPVLEKKIKNFGGFH
jgi:hypothetical protein